MYINTKYPFSLGFCWVLHLYVKDSLKNASEMFLYRNISDYTQRVNHLCEWNDVLLLCSVLNVSLQDLEQWCPHFMRFLLSHFVGAFVPAGNSLQLCPQCGISESHNTAITVFPLSFVLSFSPGGRDSDCGCTCYFLNEALVHTTVL